MIDAEYAVGSFSSKIVLSVARLHLLRNIREPNRVYQTSIGMDSIQDMQYNA